MTRPKLKARSAMVTMACGSKEVDGIDAEDHTEPSDRGSTV